MYSTIMGILMIVFFVGMVIVAVEEGSAFIAFAASPALIAGIYLLLSKT